MSKNVLTKKYNKNILEENEKEKSKKEFNKKKWSG